MTFLLHWIPSLGAALVLTVVAFALWTRIGQSEPSSAAEHKWSGSSEPTPTTKRRAAPV